ncbi:beta-N-acetylhexosaminidase [Proteiniphilum acetatigenes]|uniref:beta-N-acetylhexosaminidase n=1 Tax=Proteiniphilum acetatigenes TaxID=294710 RepID=UPI000378A6A6|nr:beta-N-acetylhexosaminidase [Proteiniphilum acetatigenes]SFK89766.1 hexosaminidase [Porphyromonadaceae bacterium KH3CP3RA]
MTRTLYFLLILLIAPLSLFSQAEKDIILPKPVSVELTEGVYKIPEKISIYAPGNILEADFFVDEVKDQCGFDAEISFDKKRANLFLSTNKKVVKKEEGYRLEIGNRKIEIIGHDDAGVFYALQSLLQLYTSAKGKGVLQTQIIDDAPVFGWRAYLVDEARYFKGEKEVYQILDEMAALKINRLHWHLTDDQGWRIEIKKYPKLTEIGSKRKDTLKGGGSDETMGEPHEGFYTQEDIKRILRYAKRRHIKMIPEIEMPGHASAAIASYPWLGSKKEQIEVPIRIEKHYPTFNVANSCVQQFLKDVIDEVFDLFETDVIHIGGDEVRFDHWQENDEVNELYKEKGFTSYMDVQIDFSNMMSRYIQDKGARMMGWNEILGKALHEDDNISFEDPSQKIADNVIVHFWKGDPNEIAKAVESGYDIVNSYHVYTYLDYSYQSIPLKKAYSFGPIPDNIPEAYRSKIIGIGCQMWSAWTPTPESIQKQTYPRIAAYAEVGWTQQDAKDYKSFLRRLNYFTDRWSRKGIKFQPVEEAN